jgi:hypothetical protein
MKLHGDNPTLLAMRVKYQAALNKAGKEVPDPCCDDDALCYTNVLLEAYEELEGNGRN